MCADIFKSLMHHFGKTYIGEIFETDCIFSLDSQILNLFQKT